MWEKQKEKQSGVYWTGDEIGNKGVKTMSEMLKTNTTLTVLDLGGTN